MFVEVDTDCAGIALQLRALAELNIWDCIQRPELASELLDRVKRGGFHYRTEPVDVWTSVAVESWRRRRLLDGPRRRALFGALCSATGLCAPEGDTDDDRWGMDCEEFAAIAAAAAILMVRADPSLTRKLSPVEVVITQPRDHGIAHAYNRIGGKVVDWAERYGMRTPPAGFYLAGETAAFTISIPVPSLFVPRS